MDATEISFGMVILLQISIGLAVNIHLLLFYICLVSIKHRLSSSDLILTHLALANVINLLTRGVPDILSLWGLRNFLDDVGCKILIYFHRVARGLSICTTCFLSIFQAITISPGTSRWSRVKAKLPKCVIPCFLSFWVLSLLIDVSALIYIIGPQNITVIEYSFMLTYCSSVSISEETTLLNTAIISLRDLFFMWLMSVASGYMVFVLHRHHRQVRHLHGPGHSPKAMPEVRAAKTVIALVTLYILLYGRDTITLSFLINMKENSPLVLNRNIIISFTFSTVSPFLMIFSDRRVKMFWKRDS
uniref:Vomeronasal type-1 receptor n=1 Tax=Ornithorhynchus anatinus TaxID=9258 RepID=F6ZQD0_ORNAN